MKKDIIITALLTFCLTATIFMVATSQSAEYDPWVDLNGDGKIDIFDVVAMTGRYGAAGSPAKNVTIAERANQLIYSVSNQAVAAGAFYTTPWIAVDGYSKVTVCLYTTATANWYQLKLMHIGGVTYFVTDGITNFGSDLVETYDVPNQQIRVDFKNSDAVSRSLYLDVYLIP